MQTYYGVCSSYYNNGKVVVNLVDTVKAKEKPQDTYKETSRCDIYVNWFDTHEKAIEFIEECKAS